MQNVFYIQSREEMLSFGRRLANAMRDTDPARQWTVSIGADADSGKSLLALAIDHRINPQRYYREGVTRDLCADSFLEPGNNGNPQVVFYNFRRIILSSRRSFDEKLTEFRAENPNAKVLIAANIERTFVGEFDYKAKGMDSDVLDISLQIHKSSAGWEREIILTTNDAGFLRRLNVLADAASLPAMQYPSIPDRTGHIRHTLSQKTLS